MGPLILGRMLQLQTRDKGRAKSMEAVQEPGSGAAELPAQSNL